MNIMDTIKAIVIIQILFSVFVNMIVYSLPSEIRNREFIESTIGNTTSEAQIVSKFSDTAKELKKTTILDYVFLIIHTGNIIIDLFLNFLIAVPSILLAIVSPLFFLVPIDPYYQLLIKGMIFSIGSVIYLIMIITLIANLRSGRQVIA